MWAIWMARWGNGKGTFSWFDYLLSRNMIANACWDNLQVGELYYTVCTIWCLCEKNGEKYYRSMKESLEIWISNEIWISLLLFFFIFRKEKLVDFSNYSCHQWRVWHVPTLCLGLCLHDLIDSPQGPYKIALLLPFAPRETEPWQCEMTCSRSHSK